MEPNVKEADAPPSEETSSSCHVGEVSEHSAGAALQRHVGQSTEKSAENNRDPWKTVFGTLGEDFRCSAGKSQTVQSSGRSVQVGGSSGPRGCQETSVDDGRQGLDSGSLDGDDEGRTGGVLASQTEVRVVRWNEKTDNECTQDVEEQDSNVNSLDRSGQVAPGVLRFTSRNSCGRKGGERDGA